MSIYLELLCPNDSILHQMLVVQTISIYHESSRPKRFQFTPKVRVPTISIYLEVRVPMISIYLERSRADDFNLPRKFASQMISSYPRKFASQRFQFTPNVRVPTISIYLEMSSRISIYLEVRVPTISIYLESSCPNDFNLPRTFASQRFQFTSKVRVRMISIYLESSRPNNFKYLEIIIGIWMSR